MNLRSVEVDGRMPAIVWCATAVAIVMFPLALVLGVLGHYGVIGH